MLVLFTATTYSTNCGLLEAAPDIPAAISSPGNQKIPLDALNCASHIVFDLETTGLSVNCGITQIAASSIDGRATFVHYIVPDQDISPGASKVSLYSHMTSGECVLFKKGKCLEAIPVLPALKAFIEWLPDNCALFVHNSVSFDMRVLMKAVEANGICESAIAKIIRFVNMLPVLKEACPLSSTSKPSGHSLGTIFERLFGASISKAHDALADVDSVHKLFGKAKPKQKCNIRNTTVAASGLTQAVF